MNAPERYERFVVPEGTKKVCYEKDTKFINAPLDTSQLQRYGNVVFSGCQLPHPLMYKIIVRGLMFCPSGCGHQTDHTSDHRSHQRLQAEMAKFSAQ